MPTPDNIDGTPADASPVDKIAKDKEAARKRAAASRLARKRAMPADADTVRETLVLCLFDMTTLPPSKRAGRAEVIADVTRQAHLTLEAMGHPDVHQSVMAVVHAMAERLRSEKWHHPLHNGAFKKYPGDTPVTPSAPHTCSTDRIAESIGSTGRVRTD